MIAVRSSLTRLRTTPEIRVIQDRPTGADMQLELYFVREDLLAEGDECIINTHLDALKHAGAMTPFGQEFLRRLFGDQPTGVKKVIITHSLMTIVHKREQPFGVDFYKEEARKAFEAEQAIRDALDL
jgi:hypothetical protein